MLIERPIEIDLQDQFDFYWEMRQKIRKPMEARKGKNGSSTHFHQYVWFFFLSKYFYLFCEIWNLSWSCDFFNLPFPIKSKRWEGKWANYFHYYFSLLILTFAFFFFFFLPSTAPKQTCVIFHHIWESYLVYFLVVLDS